MPIRIDRPLYGGAFTSTPHSSLTPSVPFVLPGELVDITATAPETLPQILEPSPNRVAPRCIHFGVCGGCQYQHATYPAQLALKTQVLVDLFAAAALNSLPAPTVHSADPWHYRNRVRLRVEPDAAGLPDLGYSRRNSNTFLPIRMCPISAPLLWRAAETLRRLASSDPFFTRWLLTVSEIELFTSDDESRLQLTLFLRSHEVARQSASSLAAFCERLLPHLPELAGAGALMHPDLPRRARLLWPGAHWKAQGLNYTAAGRSHWVSRGSFFQVNRFLVDSLPALVTSGYSGRLAWDLYAGVGLFARPLASAFAQVVAVEGGEAAAADLAQAAKGLRGEPPFHAVCSPTLDFLRANANQRDRPDLVVLDPPRAGLGPEGTEILARIASAHIAYVSCDPVTLTRDLTTFLTSGYHAKTIHFVDLFPQTYHLETIVHLTRTPA